MFNAKKLLSIGCTLALGVSLFAGCSSNGGSGSSQASSAAVPPPASSQQPSAVTNQNAMSVVRVGTLQGPAGIGMVEIMERSENKEAANIYEFTLAGAPDELSAKLISGELDIAAVPTNMGAVLYGKTEGKVKVISTSTLGVLYLLQRQEEGAGEDEEITSVADLAGKTIYSTGQGATQEYVLNYLLEKNGVGDAAIEFRAEHAELAALMVEGQAELALLPQPFITTVTMKDEASKVILDITKEWEAVTEGIQLTMGCVVVRDEYLEKNQAAVDRFLEEYKASAEWVNANVEEAAALCGKFDIIKEEVARLAIPECNIAVLTGREMKEPVAAFLDVLFTANPKSVGGALPDDQFYYIP